MRRKGERGQALVLVAAALGIFLLGAVGLAIDVGQLYAHRQMAQSAADAAAQGGIMSVFNETNVDGNAFGPDPFTCGTADTRTPCAYARLNGFGSTAADNILVEFPGSVPGVEDSLSLIRVTVQRTVPTTFMRLLGPGSGTIAASATAAIVDTLSPVPIVVLHPDLQYALDINGTPQIKICGGPPKSIQVNSRDTNAVRTRGGANVVDLSHAGPKDNGYCETGTGADFGNSGGPVPYPNEGGLYLGVGKYIAPASPIPDPLASVPVPEKPAGASLKSPLANGESGCPAAPLKPCMLYYPGLYPSGIEVKNETAVFSPGVYYMESGGFKNAANGDMYMCSGCPDADITVQGMMVYNTGGGVFEVGANAGAHLVGAPITSIYKGILLFNDRAAATAEHRLGGGGELSLKGTIYITNTKALMQGSPSTYQTVLLQGTPGSETLIEGQIITSVLRMGGNAGIEMRLDSGANLKVRQVALVR